jgi:adenine-specific DNA-methyltransferase
MAAKQKLELTWVGKEIRPKLEPRILLENTQRSYHAKHRVADDDFFDNRLIFGDNLLALKALEQEFAGKIKCVYIDPPFNTDQAFEHYDDGIEHSIWLSLMRERLVLLSNLLSSDGSIFIHIDDNELGYLIPVADEIFGRKNRISVITFKQGSATGHKAINPGCISTTNFVLWYCKNRESWRPNKVFTARGRNERYNQFIQNRKSDYAGWTIVPLARAFADSLRADPKTLKRQLPDYDKKLDEFVFANAESVVQFARPNYEAVSKDARDVIDASRASPEKVFLHKRDGYSDMYFKKGERLIFFKDTLRLIDGELVPAEPLTTLWDDIPSHNLHNEGSVDFPKGKKPEALIRRCLELATSPGDWVLDSFGGSGTTAAVAHKMRRRWVIVELGEHCHTHITPRLQKVINGEDDGGVTKSTSWGGGGGFRYYSLAPSLMEKDKWGKWVISKQYNAAMLAEAACKLEGFVYAPSDTVYWQHGKSTETDFIYVTTNHLSSEQLAQLSEEVGPERTLLVLCVTYKPHGPIAQFHNLTVKKIPNQLLTRCEWGHDDYSLKVENLPRATLPDPGNAQGGQQFLFGEEDVK